MTDRLLEEIFPELENAEAIQVYDTPEGATAALGAFEAKLQSSGQPRTRYAEVRALVAYLDAAVRALVVRLLPDESLDADIAYTLEDASQMPVQSDAVLAQLRGVHSGQAFRFRVANATLEASMQAVLDSLTADRITEELDAPTYVERLRGGFRRVRSGAASKKAAFSGLMAQAERAGARLGLIKRLAALLKSAESDIQNEGNADTFAADSEDGAAALSEFAQNSRAFAERVLAFSDFSATSLDRIENEVCSDLNIAGAEGESVLVSREAEHHVLFRAAPILWALCVTLLAKIILAHNTSEALHVVAVPILVLTYVLTWGFSIFIGVWTRQRRMRDLYKHVRQQFRQVLHDPSLKDELIEFPFLDPDTLQPDTRPIKAYAYRGKIKTNTARVYRRNLLALLLPMILLVMVLIVRNGSDQRFVARFEGTAPCVLAHGRLVFATRASFFVVPHDRTEGFWQAALNRIFPELFADVVPRRHIISVKDAVEIDPTTDATVKATAAVPRECTVVDPDRNAYTLTHVGDALDFRANLESLENLSIGVNSLVTALETGDAINLDLNAALGSGPSLTVDLGETSLEVLAQATAVGRSVPPGDNNPVIVDARNTIALELSKSDAADVDLTVLFNALGMIGETIGGDANIEQVLTVAFGGTNLTSPDVVIPDTILAMLGGDDNKFLAELRALREASETSNSLAQNFITLYSTTPMGQPSETVVISPIILEASDSAGSGSISTNLFQTTLTVGADTTELGTLGNTLVLPVFTEPVETGTGALNTLQGAFDWGRDTAKLRDPVVQDDGTTYFDRIARTIESCLIGDGIVTIDVLGLASRSWSGVPTDVSDNVLNYHLAEGRRLGALLKIAESMGDASALNRVRVVQSGETLDLSSILDRLAAPSPVADLLPAIGRFESVAAFENRRDTLLAVTGLSGETSSPLEELFARSVVLQMVSADGGPCAF